MQSRNRQYTIRRIPQHVDRKLREKARAEGRSLNEVTLETLERGLGLGKDPVVHHDLDDLAGTWVSDPEFDRVVEGMDRIDPEMWK